MLMSPSDTSKSPSVPAKDRVTSVFPSLTVIGKVALALLTGLGTPFNTLQLHGTLLLLTQPLSLDIAQGRVRVEGSASLTAQRISSRLSPLPALGSYRVQLAGGAAPSLRLQTLEGALHLSGSGQWSGGRLRFAGEASAADGMEAPISADTPATCLWPDTKKQTNTISQAL